jgi:hypothetical protein
MRALFTTIVSLGMLCTVVSAAPNLRQEINDHKITAELDAMMKEARQTEAGKRSILNDLPNRLAAEFLVPVVSGGDYSGKSDDYVYNANTAYKSSGNLTGVLREMAGALGGVRTAGQRVCVSNLNGPVQTVVIRDEATEALHQALGTSSKALAPTVHYATEVGGTPLVLSEATLGGALFSLVEEGIAAGGTTRLRLVSSDGKKVTPNDSAAQLVLQTTEGQKLKFEVELDGARNGLVNSIPKGAKWRVSGSAKQAPFQDSKSGHVQLLSVMVKEGRLSFRAPKKVAQYPSHFGKVSLPKQRLHLLGVNNAWFSSTSIKVGGAVEVFLSSDKCETNIVLSGDETTVKLGPISDLAWASTTQIRSVRPDQYDEDVGYLNGPYNSTEPSGISNRDFDSFLRRSSQCKSACAAIGKRAVSSRPLAVLEPDASAGMEQFSDRACRQSCMISGGYRSCLADSMDMRGAIDFLYKASECEDRRP